MTVFMEDKPFLHLVDYTERHFSTFLYFLLCCLAIDSLKNKINTIYKNGTPTNCITSHHF